MSSRDQEIRVNPRYQQVNVIREPEPTLIRGGSHSSLSSAASEPNTRASNNNNAAPATSSKNFNNNNNYEAYGLDDEPSDQDNEVKNDSDNNNEITLFGTKFTRSALYALALLAVGVILFLAGIVVVLTGGQPETQKKANKAAWQPPDRTVTSETMTGVTLATLGVFVSIFGAAWYCFARKNKLTKAPDNVQVVVPSEYDVHGPQTQFTDINMDDDDSDDLTTERETTPFGAGALDPHKRSLLLKQHNARYNQNIIPVNQESRRGPSTVSKVAFKDDNIEQSR